MKTRFLEFITNDHDRIALEREPSDDSYIHLIVDDGYYIQLTREEALYLSDAIQHLLGNKPLLKPLKTFNNK